MKRSLPNVILGNWAAKAPSVGAATTAEALDHQEIDAVGAAEVRVRVAGRCCQNWMQLLRSSLPSGQLRCVLEACDCQSMCHLQPCALWHIKYTQNCK